MTRLCVLAAGVQSFPRTNGRSRTRRRASSPSRLGAKTCRLKARHGSKVLCEDDEKKMLEKDVECRG